MENDRKITLADLDGLDGGSFERMVEKIKESTSDEKEIEKLTTPNIVHNFSQRFEKDKKEESSSSSNNVKPRRESDSSESEGFSKLVLGNNQGLEVKDFERRLEKSDHDISEKQQGKEKDGREKFRVANSGEEKAGKKIKITMRKNDNDKKNKYAELGLDPPPNLPASLRELVERKGGSDITLVMMKELERMDDYSQQTHLTIRVLQFKEPNFLTAKEKRILDWENGVIKVTLIQPCHEEISLGLKKLHMSNTCYVLNSEWSSVIRNEKNGLKAMDIVQLWSFRYGNNLGFVLVKVWPSQNEQCGDSRLTAA